MPDAEQHTIYTIGHSTHSAEDFIAMLRSFGIHTLVDIRSLPGSRRFPHFNRENLAPILRDNDINYIYLGGLGGRRRVTKDSQNTRWHNASFRGYADYMDTKAFEDALTELKSIAIQSPTVYMCAEAVPWRCHRSMVSDRLKADGWKVMHITAPDTAHEHSYTSPAIVAQNTVSYKNQEVMDHKFKIGDHVRWNSEAGYVSGTIIGIHTSDFDYKGYTHHATADDPQYEIKSDKSDHIAAHKGMALMKIE